MGACGFIQGSGTDFYKVIGKGSQIHKERVFVYRDIKFQKAHAFVCSAALLLDGIGIVQQCAFGIIRRTDPKPDAILAGFTLVGVMGMLIPGRSSAGVSVLVGYNGMAFVGGNRGNGKRYASQTV